MFIKRNAKDEVIGIMRLTVDDVIAGGTNELQEMLVALRTVFPFGAWKVGSGTYCGKSIEQMDDFSIKVSQKTFAESIVEVDVSAPRKKSGA